MSLVAWLMANRTPLELAKELASTAKDNAHLQERVHRLETEIFWLRDAVTRPNLGSEESMNTKTNMAHQGDGELPPLPAAWGTMYGRRDGNSEKDGYTADQMRGYAIDYGMQLGRAALAQRAGSGEAVATIVSRHGPDFRIGWLRPEHCEVGTLLYTAPPAAVQPDSVHPDDAAVDRFAKAMKEKMAASRAKGRSGWDDPNQCLVQDLATMLVEHVGRGDPVDVSNFCMMIWNRVQSGYPLGSFDIITAFINCDRPKQPDSGRDAALDDNDREMLVMSIKELCELTSGEIDALGSDNLLKPGGIKKATMADVKRKLPYVVSRLRAIVSKLDNFAQPTENAAVQPLTDAEKQTIQRAADALEGLDYEDTAGDLRAILAAASAKVLK